MGFVAFPPRENEVNGKAIRNITLRETGVFEQEAVQVSCTLWPEFDSVAVEQGDFVAVEGSYTTRNQGDKKFHNLSVTRIANVTKGFEGDRDDVENPVADDDDPLPF